MVILTEGRLKGLIIHYNVLLNKVKIHEVTYVSKERRQVYSIELLNADYLGIGSRQNFYERTSPLFTWTTKSISCRRRSETKEIYYFVPSLIPSDLKDSVIELKRGFEHFFGSVWEHKKKLQTVLDKTSKSFKERLYATIFSKEDFLKKINSGKYRVLIKVDLEVFFSMGEISLTTDFIEDCGEKGLLELTNEQVDLLETCHSYVEDSTLCFVSGKKENPLHSVSNLYEEMIKLGNDKIREIENQKLVLEKFFNYDFLDGFPYNFEDIGLEEVK